MSSQKVSESKLVEMRQRMVKALESAGISDQEVLSAFDRVPRHRFLPEVMYPMSYEVAPLVLAEDLIVPSPYIAASILEACKLNSESKILEIGTGTGYVTALLAELGAVVYTIEIEQSREESARKLLGGLGYRNIFSKLGSGLEGWAARGPFDAIIVSVALEQLPRALLGQLTSMGKLVFPIIEDEISCVIIERVDGELTTSDLGAAQFPVARKQKLDEPN